MGNWFSNIHIRKNRDVTEGNIMDMLAGLMEERGYHRTDKQDNADTVINCYISGSSEWISFSGEALAHDDPESCAGILRPLSAKLHTDALGIACFDSDYLYLNLIHSEESTDGWIGIGSGKEVGISRRSNLTAWKKKVFDYPDFARKAKQKYVIADAFLQEATSNLDMAFEQSTFSGADTPLSPPASRVIPIFFTSDEPARNSEQVQMRHYDYTLPCFMEQEASVLAINAGAAGIGLSIYFTGSYVENDEITFSDVRLYSQGETTPVQLTKEKLSNGQWAYVYRDSTFRILPKVPRRATKEKRNQMMWERRICLYFTPHGNPRKMLDITVVFVPLENPQGNTQWNVWQSQGSKKAYIDHYNKINKRVRAFEDDPDQWMPYLKIEDFDD